MRKQKEREKKIVHIGVRAKEIPTYWFVESAPEKLLKSNSGLHCLLCILLLLFSTHLPL